MLQNKFSNISEKYLILVFKILLLTIMNSKAMGQSTITFENKMGKNNSIIPSTNNAKKAAVILKSYLDKAFLSPFTIPDQEPKGIKTPSIYLKIIQYKKANLNNSFFIKSDSKNIYLIAPNEKLLRYAVYTLLEKWGFRKFTATEMYIPKISSVEFPKNTDQRFAPSFEYRVLLYPDAYDEDFRDWHKLDWYLDDFNVWGHSFSKLLPQDEYYKSNPNFYAKYEGQRTPESLCMSNDTVVSLVIKKMKSIISKTAKKPFFSVSQNDDIVYCECDKCHALNKKYGGPQGSLYFFLNKIAKQFPKTKIVTLAYLHTYKAPINLKIEPNIYTLFCPIELDRGKSIINQNIKNSFLKTLQDWNKETSHLYLWDYTVQFSSYMTPFPNIHTFSENYKLFKQNNVKGIFAQGYSDVPGDFTELRQYLLAKLLWDTGIDIKATTNDFLRGFYGKAAPFIEKYLDLLTENIKNSNTYLDIYSGPIQNINTYLSPKAMDKYDQLLNQASATIDSDSVLKSRVNKLRLALEYVYFEQSKFYGKDQYGMFYINKNKQKIVKPGLTERVQKFCETSKKFGIYELNEGGISPDEYYLEWQKIAVDTVTHLGEELKVNFLTNPASDYNKKGSYGLIDGVRGYKNYNINWIGWYGSNPEIELITNKLKFNQIKINFLNNQRHWIFIPEKITIYGFKKDKWVSLVEKDCEIIRPQKDITIYQIEINEEQFSKFSKLKIIVDNQKKLPPWKKRKNKKPMVMIDEIELYNK